MLSKKPRRKLLLPAGIVSLSLLSFLCIEYIHQRLVEKNSLGILNCVAWDPSDRDQINPNNYVTDKFIRITLTGTPEDKAKLSFAKKAIHQLLQEKDTTLGFEFTFGDHAKYASLVELCSLCEMEDVPSYFCYGHKFWILNIHPKPPRFMLCGGGVRLIRLTQENTWHNFKWILSNRLGSCQALLMLFFALIAAAIQKTINSSST